MNIVFLTSETAHHYYLINEVNRHFPIRMVFFQTKHVVKKKTLIEKLIDMIRLKSYGKIAHGLLHQLLFNGEIALQEQYEKKNFFNGQPPALDPSIPFTKVYSFNDPKTIEEIKKQNPDLIIVFGTDILKGVVLKTARLNILNIHRGIIPQYRGGAVDLWAFYHRDFQNIGTTIHVCTDNLDEGDILGQKYYQLKKGDKIYMIRYKTTLLAVELLIEILKKFIQGNIHYQKQGIGKTWSGRQLTILKEIIARRNFNRYIKSLES